MWLMTKHGFYSIVEKKPGEFHIRARVCKDLENLVERVPLPGGEILSTKEADYHFRIIVGKEEVLEVMQFLGETLDYSNFKNTIGRVPDQESKHDLYSRIWELTLRALGGFGRNPQGTRATNR
jgi:hypothetical protein